MENFRLNLEKPICFFDLETTGVEVGKDRIVEIAIIKISVDDKEERFVQRINPQMPIPPSASAIHHICDADVASEPTFKEVASGIAQFIGKSDLAGYNSNHFDIPLLLEEFLRAGVDFDMKGRKAVDVQNIFHKMEPRTLSGACRFYLGRKHEGAHGAMSDTEVTYEVFKSQLQRYDGQEYEDPKSGEILPPPIVNDIKALADFSNQRPSADFAGFIGYDSEAKEIFNFGKYKGQQVELVFDKDRGYYDWIQKSDFPLYTKKVLTEIKLRKLEGRLF